MLGAIARSRESKQERYKPGTTRRTMRERVPLPRRLVQKWRNWTTSRFVGEVPLEDACCEYGCRKTQCRLDDWTTCQNRLAYMARSVGSGAGRQRNPSQV